jgi:hypothetical protein
MTSTSCLLHETQNGNGSRKNWNSPLLQFFINCKYFPLISMLHIFNKNFYFSGYVCFSYQDAFGEKRDVSTWGKLKLALRTIPRKMRQPNGTASTVFLFMVGGPHFRSIIILGIWNLLCFLWMMLEWLGLAGKFCLLI